MAYKIGDWVVVKNGQTRNAVGYNITGWVGTKIQIYNIRGQLYDAYAGGDSHWPFNNLKSSNITAWQDRSFNVNQWVQIKSTATSETNGYNLVPRQGFVGQIQSYRFNVYSNSNWEYTVQYPDGTSNIHVAQQDLQASSAPAPTTTTTLVSPQSIVVDNIIVGIGETIGTSVFVAPDSAYAGMTVSVSNSKLASASYDLSTQTLSITGVSAGKLTGKLTSIANPNRTVTFNIVVASVNAGDVSVTVGHDSVVGYNVSPANSGLTFNVSLNDNTLATVTNGSDGNIHSTGLVAGTTTGTITCAENPNIVDVFKVTVKMDTPTAPNVSVISTNDGKIVVQVTTPTYDGNPNTVANDIQSMTLYYRAASAGAYWPNSFFIQGGATTNVTLDSLTNGQAYQFTAVSTNQDAQSAYGNVTLGTPNVPTVTTTTMIPRNISGQTLEEWVAAQQKASLNTVAGETLAQSDLVIGSDPANGFVGTKFSDLGIIVGRVSQAAAPAITEYSQQPVAKYGVDFQGMSYGARTFTIPITMRASDRDDFNNKLHAITSLLITPKTNQETSLIFGIEPQVTYYGHFSAIPDFEFQDDSTGFDTSNTLTFVASDPRGFMNVDGPASPNDIVTVDSNPFTFTPKGTGPANPIVHIMPKNGANAITRFGYSMNNNHDSVFVGMSEQTALAFDTRPIVWKTITDSMSPWNQVSSTSFDLFSDTQPSDGIIGIDSDYKRGIIATSYTQTPQNHQTVGEWLGPVMISNTGWASQIGNNNWEVRIDFNKIKYYSRADTGINFYLLDNTGQRRARIGVRDDADGSAPMAYVRFGKNYDDESKAVATGLGTAFIQPQQSSNGADKTIPLTQTTSFNGYMTSKIETTYDYYIYYWGTTTKKHYQKTVTVTTNFNADTGKNVTTTVTTPLSYWQTDDLGSTPLQHWYRTFYNGNSNTDSSGNYHLGNPQMWNKGDYVRTGDDYNGAVNYKSKYSDSTHHKWQVVNNEVHMHVVQTNIEDNNRTNVLTTDIWCPNCPDILNDKFGPVDTLTQTTTSLITGNNMATNQVYNTVSVNAPDRQESNSFSNIEGSFIIGSDAKGMYWELIKTDSAGQQVGQPLQPKTYDQRPDLHGDYAFTPDKIAVHYFKNIIAEDTYDHNTVTTTTDDSGTETSTTTSEHPSSLGAVYYKDDYIALLGVTVTKVLAPIDGADLITIKSGDEAVLDSNTNEVRINGINRNDLLDMRSDFPEIEGGVPTTITFSHDMSQISAKIEYRPTLK